MRDTKLSRAALIAVLLLVGSFGDTARAQGSNTDSLRRDVTPVSSRAEQYTSLYDGSYALVIGVSDYDHLTSLPGAKVDADSIEAVLLEHGFSVQVLRDPTADTLARAVDDFVYDHGHEENNRLLIYFAGHGFTLTTVGGDQMGYLAAADAPRPDENPRGFTRRAISMERVQAWAKEIRAKHVLFLFDACFAGTVFSALRDPAPPHIESKILWPVRQFITSGGADEQVPDNSLFRRAFVSALRGAADWIKDGFVTGTELGEYLKLEVQKNTMNHPQIGTLRITQKQGDFVFFLPGSDEFNPVDNVLLEEAFRAKLVADDAHRMALGTSGILEHARQTYLLANERKAEGEDLMSEGTWRLAADAFDESVTLYEEARTRATIIRSSAFEILNELVEPFGQYIASGDRQGIQAVFKNTQIDDTPFWEHFLEENKVRSVEIGLAGVQHVADLTVQAEIILDILYESRWNEDRRMEGILTWTVESAGGVWTVTRQARRNRDVAP